jgi:hypothetical protein
VLSAVFGFARFDNVSFGVVDADFVVEAVGLAGKAVDFEETVDFDEVTVRAGAPDGFTPATTGEAAGFDAIVLSVGMTGFVFATDFED